MHDAIPFDTAGSVQSNSAGSSGREILAAMLNIARDGLDLFRRESGSRPSVSIGNVRGTGRGVSLSRAIEVLEGAYPIELSYPFEGSDRVGGAAWIGRDLISPEEPAALAKLHWLPGADDLPMHIHPLSDRFIVVLRGRGYFHYSEQSLADFDGSSVQTIAARTGCLRLHTGHGAHLLDHRVGPRPAFMPTPVSAV
ncbi:MAG: hypothetical protein ACFHWZ_15335 [Phycisphaerales bacterium]